MALMKIRIALGLATSWLILVSMVALGGAILHASHPYATALATTTDSPLPADPPTT